MNPNHDSLPNISLPQPTSEALPTPVAQPETGPPAVGEMAPRPATPAAAVPAMPAVPVAPPTAVPVSQAVQQATAQGTPMLADDADLIEKEWVVKAKQIVERTKDDPYTQSLEMNKFKASYMKKRYNKDVKVPES